MYILQNPWLEQITCITDSSMLPTPSLHTSILSPVPVHVSTREVLEVRLEVYDM